MIRRLMVMLAFLLAPAAGAEKLRHFGDFILKSHFKVTGDRITPIPMKPIRFSVSTDGVLVRVMAAGDEEAHTTFQIYRSDGIGRPRAGTTDLDVIPGVQAMSNGGGVLRHLRLTRESLTITTFPGVSDQTIISHSLAAAPEPAPELAPPAAPPKATKTSEIEPQMNPDRRRNQSTDVQRNAHPPVEAKNLRRSLLIRVHPRPSAVYHSKLRTLLT